jgi:flagellar basal-body rod modification protein FlgD
MNTIDSLFSAGTGSPAGSAQQDAGGADRFLKLLVTQLQNQDPLNPMDNAQITSQMAQINTVTGIERLNTGLQGLTAQFMQMQALQGASLVGRDVTVAGDRLAAVDGGAQGGFALDGPADAVRVEILNPAGVVVDTVSLGALGSGRHGFEWPATGVDDPSGHRFRVAATLGAAPVTAMPLMLDRVKAVSVDGSAGLMLDLAASGPVAYGDVHALN